MKRGNDVFMGEEQERLIVIETATAKDYEAIRAIDRLTVGNDGRRELLADAINAGRCLVAMIGNAAAGFGILETWFYGQGFIGLLIVHPDYRRRGIATAIVRHIESVCPAEKLFTSTNKSNVIAQKTYEALGFIRSGYIENLDEGDPEVIYFKRLTGISPGGGRL